MKLSRFFHSKWLLVLMILLGLFYFEGHVMGKELERRSLASAENKGHKELTETGAR